MKLFLKILITLNTKLLFSILPFFILFFCNPLKAQNTYQIGGLPSLNLNSKLKNSWAINFKVESRQIYQKRIFNSTVDKRVDYVLTDFSLIVAKKVGLNSRLAVGYLTRIRDKKHIKRTIQQYTIIRKLTSSRISHRFSTDQTFFSDDSLEFRLRYRFTSEIPLNGQTVDPKEFYIKINNEYLNSWQNKDYDLECRLVPLLGYNFTDSNKTEIGLDYRINSFLNNRSRNSFWISINWFVEI